MDNRQDIQYMPVGTVKPRQSQTRQSQTRQSQGSTYYRTDKGAINTKNFKQTEINNHGKKKGTTKWNRKKIIGLVLAGAMVVVVKEGIDAYQASQKAAEVDTTIGTVQEGEMPSQTVKVEKEATYTVDYKIKVGDTLDGILYRYAETTNDMYRLKRKVMEYNKIEHESYIRDGQIITLFEVPESMVVEMNTGYDEDVDNTDKVSVLLRQEIDAMNEQYPDPAGGSLVDTINKEANVYFNTTNKDVRKMLASRMVTQLSEVEQYGNDIGVNKSR